MNNDENAMILPYGWVTSKLKSFVNLFSGFAFKSKEYATQGIPILRMGNIKKDFTLTFKKPKQPFFPEERINEFSKYLLCPRDIVMTLTDLSGGGKFLGTVAKLKSGQCAFLNQRVSKVIVSNYMNFEFVFYLLQNPNFRSYMSSDTTGSLQRNTSNNFILEYICAVPPAKEQHRIVAKIEELFTKLDAGVEALKLVQAQLKRYRQSVLKAAVEGRLTAEWQEQNKDEPEPSDKLLIRILKERREKWEAEQLAKYESKGKKPPKNWQDKYKEPTLPDTTGLPELPEGWVYGKLEDLIYIAGRIGWRGLKAEEYTTEGPLFLSVYNLNVGRNVDFSNAYHISKGRYDESPEIKLQNDDILLVKDGSGIGKIGLVKELKEKATVNSSLLVIRSGKVFVPEFLFYFLMGPSMQSIVKQRITGSATPHLFQRDIKQFILQIPPIKEQKKIVEEIERSLSVIERTELAIKSELNRAQSLRQSILKRAFEGKLVLQDLGDEPASVLLERIKAEKANKKKTKQLEMF